jgi:hypothetical protein
MVQGDTLFLNSKYADTMLMWKAYASGDAVMSSPDATLVTDIINFDRNIQEVFTIHLEQLPTKTILEKQFRQVLC